MGVLPDSFDPAKGVPATGRHAPGTRSGGHRPKEPLGLADGPSLRWMGRLGGVEPAGALRATCDERVAQWRASGETERAEGGWRSRFLRGNGRLEAAGFARLVLPGVGCRGLPMAAEAAAAQARAGRPLPLGCGDPPAAGSAAMLAEQGRCARDPAACGAPQLSADALGPAALPPRPVHAVPQSHSHRGAGNAQSRPAGAPGGSTAPPKATGEASSGTAAFAGRFSRTR